MVLIDETHHISAESWTNLASSCISATHFYGLTATAFRADGLDMAIHSFGGPIVYSRDVKWGIENGWLNSFTPISIQITPRYSSGVKVGQPIRFPDTVMATTAYKVMMGAQNVSEVIRDRLMASVNKERIPILIFKTVEACKNIRRFCKNDLDMEEQVPSQEVPTR
jgi:superfamily II DNA or RNA helicase